MLGYRWSICLTVIAVMCQESLTASIRTKRQLEQELSEQSDDINPIDAEETFADSLDRQKRKLPDGAFGAKNAIIGFVFSKIDNIIDSKTRFLDRLDQTNLEKNRMYNITVPAPINDFQGLITAVVSPKITSITQKLGSITTGVLGGLSGGGQGNDAAAGLGGIVTKFLRFSGPILQGSAGTGPSTEVSPTSDEAGY